MKKTVSGIVLSTLLASTLSAASADSAEVEQLRKDVADLKQTVNEMKSANIQSGSTATSISTVRDWTDTGLEINAKSGFQLAGYASFDWTNGENEDNRFSGVKFAPIFHYQYGSLFQFEGELEITVNAEGETEIDLEYAAGTLFINDYMGLQVGKFMSPLGQFVQNQHPSWINKLPTAPIGFGHDGAAPTSNVGAALRGGLPKIAGMRNNYVVFVSNAPRFEAGHDGASIVAEGTTSSDAAKTWGGRYAINPLGGMEIGISGATGGISEALTSGEIITRDYTVFGADFMYHTGAIDLKAEYIQQEVGEDTSLQSTLEGGKWQAFYAQASYQFSQFPVEPVVRYGQYKNPVQDREQWALGANYLFANNLIAKIAYAINAYDGREDEDVDNVLSVQLAYGF